MSIMRLSFLVMFLLVSTPVAAQQGEETGSLEAPGCSDTVDVCVAKKREEWKDRGTLGIAFNSPKPDAAGGVRWEIAGVLGGSAAADAGLARGDIILKWNGKAPGEPDFDKYWVESIRIGDEIKLEVRRGDEGRTFNVTARAPDPRTFEYWLAYYVFEDFGKEEYEAYLVKVKSKLVE